MNLVDLVGWRPWRRLALCCGVLCSLAGAWPPAASAASIDWDDWGVPHIAGKDLNDAMYGFGWAQMRANANLQLRLIAQARGRSAEIFGAGDNDSMIKADTWVRRMGVAQLAGDWLRQQSPDEKAVLNGFVAGLNAYAGSHPAEIDPALRAVLPIQPADVLARLASLMLFNLAVDEWQMTDAIDNWQKGNAAVALRDYSKAGSNGWALGKAKAQDAAALLLVNPHLPWSEPTRLFEAQIRFGDTQVYGATFVGLPFIAVGFNQSLGWTHTINPMHNFYMYQLQLAGTGYRWNGQTRAFDSRTETIAVRRLRGLYSEKKTITVDSTPYGPVVAKSAGKGLALWVPGRDAPHMIGQYWDMAKARNLAEFKSALGQQQAPIFSVVYADRDGHIYYNFGGRNPASAQPVAREQTVLDGSGDKTLWTGTLPLDALPSLTDPASGWLQNANDPPWTATWPRALEEKNFPSGLVVSDFTNLRAQQVIAQLSAAHRFRLEDIVALKQRTHVALSDRVLDDLIAAGRRSADPDAREASAVLAKWDRNINADSRGASLFISWVLFTPARANVFAEPFNPAKPTTTPQGLSDTAAAAQRLGRAARILRETEGRLDAPWGEHHKLRLGADSMPANGATDPLGVSRSTSYVADTEHGGYVANGGDSFVAAVGFGAEPRAMGLLSYGNFTQTPPAGVKAQLPLYSALRLRELRFGAQLDKQFIVLSERVAPPALPSRH
nr:penicillin acylase family protein [Duganella vulcania]